MVIIAMTLLDLKLIAIAVVSIGCFASGLLPVLLGLGTRHSNSLVMSAALCFGGGVLLATSIVHILPDVQKDLPNWSQLIFCLGFLLIYFLDILVQIITSPYTRPTTPLLVDASPTYGTINNCEDDVSSTSSCGSSVVSPSRNRENSRCSNFSLLLAFSIHSLLEGVVIGVEKTKNGVLILLVAVCCHKIIVAFCLGAELSSDGRPLSKVLPPLSVFIVGSDVGIALGSLLHPPISTMDPTILIAVLQALAGGTLLYVVVSEILPRERARYISAKAAVTQFFSVSLGFAVMAGLSSLT